MKRIPLSQGKYALVDDADYERVSQYKWSYDNNGYACRMIQVSKINGVRKRRKILLHRFIMKTPDDLDVDHIDGNKLDNRRRNLRNVKRIHNCMNRGPQPGTTSQYKGVSFYRRDSAWQVNLTVNGTRYYLGLYADETEAAKVYDEAAYKHYGEYAYLNFPERYE